MGESAVLAPFRPTHFAYSNGFGFKPTMYRKDNGNLLLSRVAVFRSGTFRDSMGVQNTWEEIHLKQMVDNFKHLQDSGTFDDIPVRDGHPGWLMRNMPGNGRVVGWHKSVVTEKAKAPHDGEEYDYLFADYEITDPDAAAQIENGTWRNRSAEIGTYITNSEAEFWPVYMGVAYVDIPAVEGLKFNSPQGREAPRLFVMMNRETGVGDNPTIAAPVQSPAQPAPASLPFAVQSVPAPQVYAVNGQQVSDPVVIQAHITALEKFRSDTTEQYRRDFVTTLASGNRIAATQVDAMTAFALGLGPEQYEAWTKTWGDAPVQSLLASHGQAVTNPGNAAQQGAQPDALATAREVVRQHKLAGTPKKVVEKTASYQTLLAAGEQVAY